MYSSDLTAVGKIVAIAIHEDIGLPLTSWEPLYQAIEKLGGTKIRNVQPRDPYAFVAITGQYRTFIFFFPHCAGHIILNNILNPNLKGQVKHKAGNVCV